MDYLNTTDYWVIGVYMAILVGLGLYLKKKASASIEDYFIGGRSLPWWALGISGMASWLDITGTMIIVSFIYMLGPRGLYIEFRGGAGLILPILLLWTGKWLRRSRCITGAEWMIFRFGDGAGGRGAQLLTSIAQIMGSIGMITYMVVGVGLFLSTFLPWPPHVCAAGLILVAAVYTMMSGFYGVVFTDIFQAGIILIAVVGVSLMTIAKVNQVDNLSAIATAVTHNPDWLSSVPHWHTQMPPGYEPYKMLMMFAMFYLIKNYLDGASHIGDPKYFGARNERECGLLSFMWTIMMMFRWPLIISFALLGIYLVQDLFPDQTVLAQAADLIKQHTEGVDKAQWRIIISDIANHSANYSADLINGLSSLLGPDWQKKLSMLSFEGTVNPERILPAVLIFAIPQGFRGMIMVALLAASMSTFDSNVNAATGLFTRDIYQKYFRPKAPTKELIYISWGFILAMVAIGFIMALKVHSINDIWGWIIMGLFVGGMFPRLLRFYWWRLNGAGVTAGTIFGLAGAVVQRLCWPELDERLQFLVIGGIGFAATIITTLLTKPTDHKTLEHFYQTTRPFGFWGPFRNSIDPETQTKMKREHRNDLLALPFATAFHVTLLMLPMQLMIRQFHDFYITAAIFVVGGVGMYFLWYRNLPPASQQD